MIKAVRALVERNEQLERQVAALGRRRMKANEGVSNDQLKQFLAKLEEQQEAKTQAERELAAKAAAYVGLPSMSSSSQVQPRHLASQFRACDRSTDRRA